MVARLVTVISRTPTPLGTALGSSLSGVWMEMQHLCLPFNSQGSGCVVASLLYTVDSEENERGEGSK